MQRSFLEYLEQDVNSSAERGEYTTEGPQQGFKCPLEIRGDRSGTICGAEMSAMNVEAHLKACHVQDNGRRTWSDVESYADQFRRRRHAMEEETQHWAKFANEAAVTESISETRQVKVMKNQGDFGTVGDQDSDEDVENASIEAPSSALTQSLHVSGPRDGHEDEPSTNSVPATDWRTRWSKSLTESQRNIRSDNEDIHSISSTSSTSSSDESVQPESSPIITALANAKQRKRLHRKFKGARLVDGDFRPSQHEDPNVEDEPESAKVAAELAKDPLELTSPGKRPAPTRRTADKPAKKVKISTKGIGNVSSNEPERQVGSEAAGPHDGSDLPEYEDVTSSPEVRRGPHLRSSMQQQPRAPPPTPAVASSSSRFGDTSARSLADAFQTRRNSGEATLPNASTREILDGLGTGEKIQGRASTVGGTSGADVRSKDVDEEVGCAGRKDQRTIQSPIEKRVTRAANRDAE